MKVEFPKKNGLYVAKVSLTVNGQLSALGLCATYFVFSTWFSDCLPFAACILIVGPRPEARFLVELLACLVRNPLPVDMLTQARFLRLPLALSPTLLIDDERIGPSIWGLLQASNRRNAYVLLKDARHNIYCAKVIYCGTKPGDPGDSTLKINLQPSRGPLLVLEASDKEFICNEFRPRLEAYGTAGFAREGVLNHRIGRNGRLNPGATVEGLLLGVGQG